MHISIRYSIGPAYWPNVLCLLLVLELPRIRRREARTRVSWSTLSQVRGTRLAIGIGTTAILTFAYVAVCHVSYWPFTNVYMYSSVFSTDDEIRADEPRKDYYDPHGIQRIATRLHQHSISIEQSEYLCNLCLLRMNGPNVEPVYLWEPPGVASWKQWMLTNCQPVLLEHLNQHEISGTSSLQYLASPLTDLLREYAEIVGESLPAEGRWTRLELVYPIAVDPSQGDGVTPLPERVLDYYKTIEVQEVGDVQLIPFASAPIDPE